jgi:cytochrome oxidase Cu insertion factor (SCO1/SenC/PrrC family)
MKPILLLLTLLGVTSGQLFAAQHQRSADAALAPGYGDLEFEPPVPGSYNLPVLGHAADSKLLDSKGDLASLHGLMRNKFILLGFIYTHCSDVNGCPLASYVMARVQDRVMEDTALKDYVRLVSFSFDPANDTPEVLEQYARQFRKAGSDWHFVTARSAEELDATLEAYNQFVIRDYDQEGKFLGSISHMLRVYLIDQNRDIRNIYSVSFLHPDTVINDIRTIVGRNTADSNTADSKLAAVENVAGN